MPAEEMINRIRKLLGEPAVLIPIQSKRKTPRMKWGNITVQDMESQEHINKLLSHTNVGVVLGDRSGGLISIDLDDDDLMDELLELNPILGTTLTTRAARGCNIWLRINGPLPALSKINRGDRHLGEIRSTGGYTIICGVHPDGMDYRFITERPAIQIRFNQIKWPEGVDWNKGHNDTEDTEDTEDTNEIGVVGEQKKPDLSDIIGDFVPNGPHQNHKLLFNLARRVLSYEIERDKPFDLTELIGIFDAWHSSSLNFLRPELEKEDYFEEFMSCYQYALFPECDDIVKFALSKVVQGEYPPEVDLFDTPNESFKQLVALCYHMSKIAKNGVFFLSCRKAQEVLGLSSFIATSRWLRLLVRLGILQIEAEETKYRARRYRYISRGGR